MDTTAVSSTDLVKRRQINKWRDYHLLRHLIRQAYLSEDGYYEMEAEHLRLSMFKFRSVMKGVVSFHTFYSEVERKYMISCIIN